VTGQLIAVVYEFDEGLHLEMKKWDEQNNQAFFSCAHTLQQNKVQGHS
jgi:hypothetical protein